MATAPDDRMEGGPGRSDQARVQDPTGPGSGSQPTTRCATPPSPTVNVQVRGGFWRPLRSPIFYRTSTEQSV